MSTISATIYGLIAASIIWTIFYSIGRAVFSSTSELEKNPGNKSLQETVKKQMTNVHIMSAVAALLLGGFVFLFNYR